MLATLGGVLYRARWFVLLIGLAVVLGAAVFGSGLFGKLTAGGFEDPNSQSAHAHALLDQQLGGSTADIVILMHSDAQSASDPAFASAATQLLSTLHARPEVASVTSYYSTHSARFLSRDGHETFAVVQLAATDQTAKDRDYKRLLPLIASPTLQISIGGNRAVNAAINGQVSADLEHAEMITFPVVGILLVIVFAGLVAAGLPLLIGGIAILGAFALLRLLTGVTDISIFAINVVTVLGLGLAIDYALFIVTRFREEVAANGGQTRWALERTMSPAGRTVLFSGLTVSVSLLGLLLFPEGFLRSMGLGAIGAVLVAMLAALTILPALLAVLGTRVNALSLQRLVRRSSARRQTAQLRHALADSGGAGGAGGARDAGAALPARLLLHPRRAGAAGGSRVARRCRAAHAGFRTAGCGGDRHRRTHARRRTFARQPGEFAKLRGADSSDARRHRGPEPGNRGPGAHAG